MPLYDVVVIGAGAAGLMAALQLPAGWQVCILESQAEPGRKLLATGNGRCNFSNQELSDTHYHGMNPWFAAGILQRFDTRWAVSTFRKYGLFVRSEEGRLYPYSMQARSLVDCLLQQLTRRANTCLVTGAAVTAVEPRNADFVGGRRTFDVRTADGARYSAKRVLVCAGGSASPELGSDGSGIRLMAALGLPMVPVWPALVQLVCRQVPKRLAGIRVQARLTAKPPCQSAGHPRMARAVSQTGEVLLTDYGLSGIPVLNMSGTVAEWLTHAGAVEVFMDLLPEVPASRLLDEIRQKQRDLPDAPADQWGTGFLAFKLSRVLLELVVGADRALSLQLGRLPDQQLIRLVDLAKGWARPVVGTKGFKHAQVTAGGLDTGAFDPVTLESVVLPGLFAAGEILDIYGDCGGYNLHWAWASAAAAAEGMRRNHDRH